LGRKTRKERRVEAGWVEDLTLASDENDVLGVINLRCCPQKAERTLYSSFSPCFLALKLTAMPLDQY